jgi:hypothetical protein
MNLNHVLKKVGRGSSHESWPIFKLIFSESTCSGVSKTSYGCCVPQHDVTTSLSFSGYHHHTLRCVKDTRKELLCPKKVGNKSSIFRSESIWKLEQKSLTIILHLGTGALADLGKIILKVILDQIKVIAKKTI